MSNSTPAPKPVTKDETQVSESTRKNSSTRPPEQALKCPRCDSPNTKFCYYNNYSLTQPRHFCKTCRRYWTNGGALRNVPIGGGCRKNKKVKSLSTSRLSGSTDPSKDDSCSSAEIGGFKFLHGFSSPAMDFSFPRPLNASATGFYSNFSSFGDVNSAYCLDPSGNSIDNSLMGYNNNYPVMSSLNVHSSLASSIESLSSLNQDLHWKLQHQRLAMLQKDCGVSNSLTLDHQNQTQKMQPILFQNLEASSKRDVCTNSGNVRRDHQGVITSGDSTAPAAEWLFGNSYEAPATLPSTTNNGINSWNGIQGWNDLHGQYSSLP